MTNLKKDSAIVRGIKKVGSLDAVGKRLGVSRQAVGMWAKKGIVPADKALAFSKLTGVPRSEANPIIYPPDLF